MRLALVAALLVLSAAAVSAAAPRGGFSAQSFGEGGGYKHSDAATGQYLENAPRYNNAPPAPMPIKSAPLPPPPSLPASALLPEAAGGSPVVKIPFAPPAAESSAGPSEEAPANSVEDSAPRTSPEPRSSPRRADAGPAVAVGAAVDDSGPDAVSEEGRRDYETRVLGLRDSPRRPPLQDPPGFRGPEAPARAEGERRLFVSIELDPREAGTLRDAVAGLGAATGFSPDARFEPLVGPSGLSMISGWIFASRLGEAVSRPGVRRLRLETGARPSFSTETSGEFLVALRVDDPSRAQEAVEAAVKSLATAVDFVSTSGARLETLPGGRTVAVVAGRLPLSQLSRAMGRPEVVKIVSRPWAPPVPAPAASPGPSSPERRFSALGFARFVAEHGLWLLLITLALALPVLREALIRILCIFVPYR